MSRIFFRVFAQHHLERHGPALAPPRVGNQNQGRSSAATSGTGWDVASPKGPDESLGEFSIQRFGRERQAGERVEVA